MKCPSKIPGALLPQFLPCGCIMKKRPGQRFRVQVFQTAAREWVCMCGTYWVVAIQIRRVAGRRCPVSGIP